MRTGPELFAATKRYAKEDRAKSWWHVISTGLLLVGATGLTFLDVNPLLRLAFSVLTGLLILRFFVIYHDQQHHAILDKSRLAEGLMRVFGLYSLSASSIWRSSHNYHHNHNSKLRSAHVGSFPIMTKAQFLKSSRPILIEEKLCQAVKRPWAACSAKISPDIRASNCGPLYPAVQAAADLGSGLPPKMWSTMTAKGHGFNRFAAMLATSRSRAKRIRQTSGL